LVSLKKSILVLLIIFSLSVYLLFVFFNTESTIIENTELKKLPKKIIPINIIGELGSDSKQFDNPEGMDFFNEKLYVLDTNNSRIQIFSKNLELLSILPLAINDARGIAVTNEKIFVVETYDYIIKSFDHTGNFLNNFSVTWTIDFLADENFVYVIEPLIESIQVYDHNGNSIYNLKGIRNLHFLDSNDQYFIASGTHIAHDPHELLLIDKETRVIEQRFPTSPGTTHGSVITENSIFLLDDGSLKIFDFNGNLLLEYLIEIPSTNSSLSQIEINNNILYVLDTHAHNIHMLEIIYE
tara:strand:- start:1506 stop:2396 length:891 start_codon:yes stop_codon:yes gene_type:complete